MASRAHLLAGLRTGGPRSSSPFEGERPEKEQSSPHSSSGSPSANSGILKANAAPFTPGNRVTSKQSSGSDGQAAAFRMQQAIAAAAASQRQASYSMGDDLAAMYGASQGQPQQLNAAEYQQLEMANLIRQKQAQMLQNQMLAQQQQQEVSLPCCYCLDTFALSYILSLLLLLLLLQLEIYRLQAASQQRQHLQQVAAQQRLLLAQMQVEYNQQQQENMYTAQDQRMAAQASIQASLRQRQAEQVYSQMMDNQGDEAQMQQQQLLQRLQFLQLQAAAMQGMQDVSLGEDSTHQTLMQNRRNDSPRADSPSAAQQQNRRDRQASQAAADSATSWRSTSLSLPQGGRPSVGRTPSIVVDDSASERSDASLVEDTDTPETSEEDVSNGILALTKDLNNNRLGTTKQTPSASPRPLSLSQAPRSRAFSSDGKANSPVNGGGGNGSISNASRQPRGPPTEFQSINFTSRLSARTRREAMSKLCASPRAASFNMVSRPAVVA